MTPSASVRATLDLAAAVAGTSADVRAVVVLVEWPRVRVIGEPADLRELPAGLRAAMESAVMGRERGCPCCWALACACRCEHGPQPMGEA